MTGVHYGVLPAREREGEKKKKGGRDAKLEMSPALLDKLDITLLVNMTEMGYGIP